MRNVFSGNGTTNDTYSGDITLEGGFLGQQASVNNCVSNNTLVKTFPANIQAGWGCQNTTTPNPGVDPIPRILQLQAESQNRTSVPQPAPGPQPTMPNPCRGVPANPLCG